MKLFWISAVFAAIGLVRAQQPDEKPRFEVASIKPSDPDRYNPLFVGMSADGAIVTYTNITLRDCIRAAYRMRDFQIIGPGWMTDARPGSGKWRTEAHASSV